MTLAAMHFEVDAAASMLSATRAGGGGGDCDRIPMICDVTI